MTAKRLWRSDGVAGTLVDHPDRYGRVLVLVDGEREPVRQPFADWWFAWSCDYCSSDAEVQLRDGQPEDLLCRRCARSQFDRVAEWVRPIPAVVIRGLLEESRRRAAPCLASSRLDLFGGCFVGVDGRPTVTEREL